MKVYQDKGGVYIKHGNDKVRPMLPLSWRRRGLTGPEYQAANKIANSNYRLDNTTKVDPSQPVKKHHYGGTVVVKIAQGDIVERWFIQGENQERE